MRFGLVVVGIVGILFLVLVSLPTYKLASLPLQVEGVAGVPLSARATELLEKTRLGALDIVNQQRRWQRISIYLGFIGLTMTALATLYAGWKSKDTRSKNDEFLNKKIMIIGGFTALATLAAGASDLSERVGVKPLENSVSTLKKALIEVPAEIAVNPGAESRILDVLQITLAQHLP